MAQRTSIFGDVLAAASTEASQPCGQGRPRPLRQPTIEELLAALARRDVSSEELVAGRLDRLEHRWRGLNAFVEVCAEDALRRARASDLRRREGAPPRLLEGVPIALKDMFATPGRDCTFGAPPTDLSRGRGLAPVVRRLMEAGAINLGFLNMAPFALGATGHNPTFGDCRNPWDPSRIPGGSSSGAGAVVAAGVAAAAVGSDTGGSIRIPAACCGVVGLRATTDRVSSYGALPLAPPFDVVSPIATCVADVARVFEVISGVRTHIADGAGATTRLVYPQSQVFAGADPEIAGAVDRAVSLLATQGARVEAATLPDLAELHRLAEVVQAFEAAALHGHRLSLHPDAYAPHIQRRIEPGLVVSARAHAEALAERQGRREAFVREVLGGDGVLVVPTVPRPTPTLAETDPEGPLGDAVAALTRWTRWVSYLDLPALSLPCGFDSHGMPIGLQLVAAPGQEHRLLGAAAMYEQLAQWSNQPETSAA